MSSSTLSNADTGRGAWPFWVTAVLAIVGGGLISGVLAHAPSRQVMWLVAYLVLVVGVAQVALAVGQARLAPSPASRVLLASEWVLFNVANALVMAGTLLAHAAWVNVGALVLAAALALFLRGVRGATGGWPVYAFRSLLGLLGCSALVGVALTLWRTRP